MKPRLAVLIAFLTLLTFGARAQAPAVDLLLVLAVDASGSVNPERFELQKHGYAEAFRDPRVLEAITAGSRHTIAVTMVQWTGPRLHAQTVDWMHVSDAESATTLATAIDQSTRRLFGGGTSLSGAIDYSMELLAANPVKAARRVIDVSGDGSNNGGRPASDARDAAVKAGVTINGLPIAWIEPDLASYYRDNVIGGFGAFVVGIDSYDNFADAIINKLVTEIAGTTPPRLASTDPR
jgi:hypothetical protein